MLPSSSSSSRAPLLWVGLVLMCGGLFLAAVLWFVFFIGGAVFVVGLVLVLVSGQSAGRKALAIGFPFMGWIGVAAGAWALAPRGPATTFLIPEGYEGTIMLVKDEQCAPPPEFEDGRQVYRIPESGLLLTRDTIPNRENPYYDWGHRGYYLRPYNRYYLVNKQGQRVRELTEVHAATSSDEAPSPTDSWGSVSRRELAVFYSDPFPPFPDSSGFGCAFQYLTIATQDSLYQYRRFGRHEPLALQALARQVLPPRRVRIGQPPQGIWKPKPNPFDSTAH